MSRSTVKKKNPTPPQKKTPGLTVNTDQPDHPSSLNRILDSSCALVMSTQGPKAFSREQRILLK